MEHAKFNEEVSYDSFFRLTTEASRLYGSIFDLPVAEEPYVYLARAYRKQFPNGKVLDFGCGANKVLQDVLGIKDSNYFTCDNDPEASVTYMNLDEIPFDTKFHIVVANQVLEHLTFNSCINAVKDMAQVLAPGGILLLSVPNPLHPTRYLSNPTHITPLNYKNLYALLTLAGLKTIRCARCNKVSGPRWHEKYLVNMICRVFRMDWCDTVYVVGENAT